MSSLEVLKNLDELTAALKGSDPGAQSAGSCGLIREHLRAARTAFLGAMQGEYRLNLEQAMESISCIPEKSARIKSKHVLQSLIDLSAPKSLLPAAF